MKEQPEMSLENCEIDTTLIKCTRIKITVITKY